MKNLRKLALASAVSAAACGAHAELLQLDDESMQNVSGQAGLTIDVESHWEIGEFAYHDAGFLVIQGLRMGGKDLHTVGSADYYLDNLRLEIDVAGAGQVDGVTTTADAGNTFNYGFSGMRQIAQMYVDEGNTDAEFDEIATNGMDIKRNAAVDDKKTYDDGDLVIHFDFTDGWQKSAQGSYAAYAANPANFVSDTYDNVELMLEHAVDFRFEIDAIGIATSDYVVGSQVMDIDTRASNGLDPTPETTTLISQLGIQGYLGPEDLHIENNGNGFGADGSGRDINGNGDPTDDANGNADSKITWSTYFKVTDLDVYIDIAGVQIRDMEIHNERGDRTGIDGTSSFDFAHSIREIYAVRDNVLNLESYAAGNGAYVDGIAINTRFKGDIDIKHLSFGDSGTSIGEIYLTDVYSDTRWVISAH
jgi:hypothetical protein